MQKKCFILFIILLASQTVSAQQVQTSVMAGPHKIDFQTFLIQPLDKTGNFTFTNLAFFQRYTEAEDQLFDELGVQGAVFWNITRSLGIGPGLYYNSPKGLMPKLLLQTFNKVGPVTLITNPALYYHEDGFWGAELFAQATAIKPIENGWSVFVQLNTLTTWDRFEDHGRSYIQLRAGPRLDSGIQFGFAYDRDWYSPRKLDQSSVGLFLEQWFLNGNGNRGFRQ